MNTLLEYRREIAVLFLIVIVFLTFGVVTRGYVRNLEDEIARQIEINRLHEAAESDLEVRVSALYDVVSVPDSVLLKYKP